MNNIPATIIICYGAIAIAIAITFASQPPASSEEELAVRIVTITFWPVAVYVAYQDGVDALEAKRESEE